MANPKYKQGRRLEYRAMEKLREIGERPYRMAGSHGEADIISVCASHVRMVQVKSGEKRITLAEREAFELLACPNNTIKQIWHWRKIKNKYELTVEDI